MCIRRRLLCSLPLVTLTLLAAGPAAAAGADLPTKMVEVKDAGVRPQKRLLENATFSDAGENGTLVWTDLGVADAAAPLAGAGGAEAFARRVFAPAQAPAVIAAPLPPALLTGLMGLAGVYAYQRRRRLA